MQDVHRNYDVDVASDVNFGEYCYEYRDPFEDPRPEFLEGVSKTTKDATHFNQSPTETGFGMRFRPVTALFTRSVVTS
jgi:hypothetical protein